MVPGDLGQHRPIIDLHLATEKARLGDIDAGIELARTVVDRVFARGSAICSALTTAVLVKAVLRRGSGTDLREARATTERLAAAPATGFVLHEIWLLRVRALLAQVRDEETGYREFRDRYHNMAGSLGYEGHIAWAEAMP